MNTAYLLIGGNLGNVSQTFIHVISDLEKCNISLRRKSSLYKTAAWGLEDQPDFLNAVLEVDTTLSSIQLLRTILAIEKKEGRARSEKYGPRIIDIDILFYNNDIVREPQLIIPHPRIQERNFVLYPLAELIPDFVHPVLKKSIAQLLLESKDKLKVEKIAE